MGWTKDFAALVDQSSVVANEQASVEAIEVIYRQRHQQFVRVAQAITRSRESAVDAVQEGFASALRHRAAFRGDGPLEAWVWRAIVNTARRTLRGPEPAVFETAEAVAPDRPDDDDAVRTAIGALPERQRLVLFLRYYADLDYRAIASALELEVGTVGATLNQAHANLKRLLAGVSC
jgi:RNA polymerase sigma-70 factor (ECF subfamily)